MTIPEHFWPETQWRAFIYADEYRHAVRNKDCILGLYYYIASHYRSRIYVFIPKEFKEDVVRPWYEAFKREARWKFDDPTFRRVRI